MPTLIEQAARRLEELRQGGAAIRNDKRPTESPSTAQEAAGVAATRRQSSYVELDLRAIAAAGIAQVPGTRVTDEFRVIKRPLIRNFLGKGAAAVADANRIMVTSALSGEGKSFTAINLAMSIAAEIDNKVLLVDADVVRPSVLRMFGLPPRAGLLDVLRDPSLDLSEVLLKTNLEKLSILSSGTPCARATELLASDAMAALVEEMANRYPDRLIIFDSPPLLLTTESQALASHMGQIVVVVDAGRTLQRDVRQALSTIEGCPVKLTVLNRVREAAQAGYGYGYGY